MLTIKQTLVLTIGVQLLLVTPTTLAGGNTSKFTAYKPSHVMVMQRPDDDETLAVRVSLKYQLMDCLERKSRNKSGGICNHILNGNRFLFGHWANSSAFFSYTTDFDFYLFGDSEQGRPSKPVVNRMTSPAFHLRLNARDTPPQKHRLRNVWLSLVHHSNGQIRDENNFNPDRADTETYWRDGLSRGWNYIELKFDSLHYFQYKAEDRKGLCKTDSRCWTSSLAFKIPIFDHDDDIWWGEQLHPGSYPEHNRIELTLSTESVSKTTSSLRGWQFSTQLQCGQRGCGLNTWVRADVEFMNLTLPLMLYSHIGRNEHYYNYNEKNNYVGFGLQFRP